MNRLNLIKMLNYVIKMHTKNRWRHGQAVIKLKNLQKINLRDEDFGKRSI